MATQTPEASSAAPIEQVPELRAGDRLSRAEFHRRYQAMPDLNKAELIEGVVYMPSPVSNDDHGSPHFDLIGWLAYYRAHTPGVAGADNATLLLDWDNEPQPDAFLRILPECGGQSRKRGTYVEGAPELIAEVAASSASYDLHDKLNAYRRNGVREYVVWRVWDREIDWFVLREGRFDRLAAAAESIYQSGVFPGLWLDAPSLIDGNLAKVLQVLQQGVASREHAQFVGRLAEADKSSNDA